MWHRLTDSCSRTGHTHQLQQGLHFHSLVPPRSKTGDPAPADEDRETHRNKSQCEEKIKGSLHLHLCHGPFWPAFRNPIRDEGESHHDENPLRTHSSTSFRFKVYFWHNYRRGWSVLSHARARNHRPLRLQTHKHRPASLQLYHWIQTLDVFQPSSPPSHWESGNLTGLPSK